MNRGIRKNELEVSPRSTDDKSQRMESRKLWLTNNHRCLAYSHGHVPTKYRDRERTLGWLEVTCGQIGRYIRRSQPGVFCGLLHLQSLNVDEAHCGRRLLSGRSQGASARKPGSGASPQHHTFRCC